MSFSDLKNYQPVSDWGKQLYWKGWAVGRNERGIDPSVPDRAEAARFRKDGFLEGFATATIIVLESKGMPVTPEVREHICTCRDIEELYRWLRLAAPAQTDSTFGGRDNEEADPVPARKA